MDGSTVLRKTLLGQEEIKSRAGNIDKILRNLLIFVNGKLTVDDMHVTLTKMPSYQGMDYLKQSLQVLKDGGYITDASERVTKIASEYGIGNWSEAQAGEIKNLLIDVAHKTLGKNADKVINKLKKAPDTKEGVIAAVDASEKLVRLFIDEKQASLLAKQCRAAISGFN